MKKTFEDLKLVLRGLGIGAALIAVLMLGSAAYYPPPASSVTVINNLQQITVTNLYSTNLFSSNANFFQTYISNLTVQSNATFLQSVVINSNLTVQSNLFINQSLIVQSNVTVNQNINVSGKANLTMIFLTNNIYTATNAEPTMNVWDVSKDTTITNCSADPTITSLQGVSNGLTFSAKLLVLANGANRTFTMGVANVHQSPSGTLVSTNGSAAVESIWGVGGSYTAAVFFPFP